MELTIRISNPEELANLIAKAINGASSTKAGNTGRATGKGPAKKATEAEAQEMPDLDEEAEYEEELDEYGQEEELDEPAAPARKATTGAKGKPASGAKATGATNTSKGSGTAVGVTDKQLINACLAHQARHNRAATVAVLKKHKVKAAIDVKPADRPAFMKALKA